VQCDIKMVAMESTGVYWIPLHEVLEDRGPEVVLVNARQVHNVRGDNQCLGTTATIESAASAAGRGPQRDESSQPLNYTSHLVWGEPNAKDKKEISIDILHRRLQEKSSCVKCKPLRIKVSGIRASSWSHGTPRRSDAEVARGLPREAAGLYPMRSVTGTSRR
jgi:hypothetical protein